jgi:8-oxo-dGTP diphosphatase
VTFCYAGRLEGGQLAPQAAEILELKFFAPEALPPRPAWYADMLDHALREQSAPYFDPPAREPLETPYPSLLDLRRVVGSQLLLWPGASAAVWDDAGRLLLQRRSDNGQWALPAGALDVGETLAHTAVRETREETGLEVEPVNLVLAYGGHLLILPNGHQIMPAGALFACRRVGGTLRPDGRESTAARFFAREEVPALAPHVRERVEVAFAAGPGS